MSACSDPIPVFVREEFEFQLPKIKSDGNLVKPLESNSNTDNDLDEVGSFCGSEEDRRKFVKYWTQKFIKSINENEFIDVNENEFNENKEII